MMISEKNPIIAHTPYVLFGTPEDERTVLYRTKSLDGTKPNTNSNPRQNIVLVLYTCAER